MHIKTISMINRIREILFIMIKYGFEDLVEKAEMPGMGIFKKLRPIRKEMDTSERIVAMLEELGPTFIKFGQILSLRPDLLPVELIDKLSRLQDRVGPEEYPIIKEALENSLNSDINQVFSRFDIEPIAGGSLSQVHYAVLREEGQKVAVKIRRPDIERKVETDLFIIGLIAKRLHNRISEIRSYRLPDLIRELKRIMAEEMDFRIEAKNLKIARKNHISDPEIYIPKVFDGYCTKELLITEFIEGKRLTEIGQENSLDLHDIARKGLRIAIKQAFIYGFFHADPHPGNIFVKEDGKICLLDWGIAGQITETDKEDLLRILRAIASKDSRELLNALFFLTGGGFGIQRRDLERGLASLIYMVYSESLRDINLGAFLRELNKLINRYGLTLPPDLALMIKALITADGTARRLYPDIDLIGETEDIIREIYDTRYRPSLFLSRIKRHLSDTLILQRYLIHRFSDIVEKIHLGELNLRFEPHNIENLERRIENIANRITLGIVLAGIIIGSSLIISKGAGPLIFGMPLFGLAGYLLSLLIGIWIIYNILRSKRL